MAESDLAPPSSDLELIEHAARKAGEIAMSYFRADNQVWHKHGNSPVSEADFAVDRFLTETLRTARPDYGWLSEETEDSGERLSASRIFVVDPIDGTRGFIDGRKEWCISVAVVENGVPVAGVLECPALSETFAAASGEGSRLNGRPLERLSGIGVLSITASRKLNDAISASPGNELTVVPFIPSLAYRLAMVASRKVDAAFARPGASEWDIAAADIILRETGGALVDLDGVQPQYNRPATKSGPLLAAGTEAVKGVIELAKSGGFLH